MIGVGFGAAGCLVTSLLHEPPLLIAAGMSALLGWLACYAYMLQRECRLLVAGCHQFGPSTTAAGDCHVSKLTGLAARSDGSPADGGSSGYSVQAVMASVLVKEYLGAVTLLQDYQRRHGALPGDTATSDCLHVGEALLAGLRGDLVAIANDEGGQMGGSPT